MRLGLESQLFTKPDSRFLEASPCMHTIHRHSASLGREDPQSSLFTITLRTCVDVCVRKPLILFWIRPRSCLALAPFWQITPPHTHTHTPVIPKFGAFLYLPHLRRHNQGTQPSWPHGGWPVSSPAENLGFEDNCAAGTRWSQLGDGSWGPAAASVSAVPLILTQGRVATPLGPV